MENSYIRFNIDTKKAPNLEPHPYRFNVKVNRFRLASLLASELIHYGKDFPVTLSRPCVYGVFSGPVGGFAPRESLCVGCLRCTVEYPDMVTISPNQERMTLGDTYFTPDYYDTIIYEAETGRIPVRGAGFRGKFGGQGWDGMWTDMSEIVRPTRDGFHGREFISTQVDIGTVPHHLSFDKERNIFGDIPHTESIPLPFIFDVLPEHSNNRVPYKSLIHVAEILNIFTIIPLDEIETHHFKSKRIIPLVDVNQIDTIEQLSWDPHFIEIVSWDKHLYEILIKKFPHALVILRIDSDESNYVKAYEKGIRVFHMTANYHGTGKKGTFILDSILAKHQEFVKQKLRDQVTLIGSGGIIAAEHMAKGIICGLDAIALDTPVMVALQAQFHGQCVDRQTSRFTLPVKITEEWASQRLLNLSASWHDQLLEILGAMGLREVRRLRGEIGRAMFQTKLEQEAFAGITIDEQG